MAYIYNVVTEYESYVTADGEGVHFQPDLEWDGVFVPLGVPLMFLRGLEFGGSKGKIVVVVGKGQSGPYEDKTVLVNSLGHTAVVGNNHGNHAHDVAVFGPDLVVVVWVDKDGFRYGTRVYNAYTLEPASDVVWTPMAGTFSEGFVDLDERFNPMWTHEHHMVTLAGLTFYLPFTRGDWTVGQHRDNFVIAHKHSTGENFIVWDGETQVQARNNSRGTVAVSAEPTTKLFITPDEFKPYTEPLPPVELVEHQDRPFLVAPFLFNDTTTGAVNWNTFSNNVLPIRPKGLYHGTIATREDILTGRVTEPFAVWAGEDSGKSTEAVVTDLRPLANELGAGLVVYQDSFPVRQSVLDLLKPQDILAPQFYRGAGESLRDFTGRMADESERLKHYRLAPVVSVYDRNKTLSNAEIAEAIIMVSTVAKEDKWYGTFLFRVGTSDGYSTESHPELLPYLEAFCAGSLPASKPTIPEESVAIKTALSHLVTNFRFGDFDMGTETRPAYAIGADETVEVVRNSDGTYSIKNNSGTEWLSVQPDGSIQSRPVSDPSQPRTWEKFDKKGNSLVERSKDGHGGTIPAGRPPVTYLVAGSL